MQKFDDIADEGYNLGEFVGYNKELDELFYSRCRNEEILPEAIDFNNVVYFYCLSHITYNERKYTMDEPVRFYIELTDEEYMYLLENQIALGRFFTFNKLLIDNPDLARKINYFACNDFDDCALNVNDPYLIQFDEIADDVLKAIGPHHEEIILYEESSEVTALIINGCVN